MAGNSAPYLSTIQSAAAQYGIDPAILYGVLQDESNFNPNPPNAGAGAIGIAQFIPSTAQQYGVNPTDPTSSIYGAAHYLSDLYNEFGSWTSALTAYNAGPGNVQTYGPQGAANLPGADPAYAQKVLSYAAGYSGTPVAAPSGPVAGSTAGAPASQGGWLSNLTGGGGFLGSALSTGTGPYQGIPGVNLAQPFGADPLGLGPISQQVETFTANLALQVVIAVLAIVLVLGGVAWAASAHDINLPVPSPSGGGSSSGGKAPAVASTAEDLAFV